MHVMIAMIVYEFINSLCFKKISSTILMIIEENVKASSVTGIGTIPTAGNYHLVGLLGNYPVSSNDRF